MSFFNQERTLVVAHRGASAAAPQNTVAAFTKAMELGADAIEFDVQLSADGVPVVIHDDTVDATTDGSGRVDAMTVDELKQLDAGSSFDPAFAGEPIPTLDEVFDAVDESLLMNVELKTAALFDNGLERAVATRIERYGLSDRVLFSSFNPFSLRRIKKVAPHIPAALLYADDQPIHLRNAWLAPIVAHEARHPKYTMVDADYMDWARRKGYRVNVWTVDEPEEMERLIDLGVDGIVTNVPDRLLKVLEQRGGA